MTRRPTILVGVDDSAPGRAALAFAIEDAVRRGGARVRAVHVFPPLRYWSVPHSTPAPPMPAELTSLIEDRIREVATEILAVAPVGSAPVTVTAKALPGQPARVLLDEAARADLLVVGHRGRGEVASALLGSVSMQCVLHAPCTVTVVRPALVTAPERAAFDFRMAMAPAEPVTDAG